MTHHQKRWCAFLYNASNTQLLSMQACNTYMYQLLCYCFPKKSCSIFQSDYYLVQELIEIRCVSSREEQLRIVQACHADPTSGHLGFRRTMARITERFFWKGIARDSKDVVRKPNLQSVQCVTGAVFPCHQVCKCIHHTCFTEISLTKSLAKFLYAHAGVV